ncbi:MAG: CAP domain-containing protein [Chloroflexi bacterium]|nr:MAG: CAP domain-containing protein [Chloroflexota bacterium]
MKRSVLPCLGMFAVATLTLSAAARAQSAADVPLPPPFMPDAANATQALPPPPATVQPSATASFDPTTQTPGLMLDEARTVYLVNLTRQAHGLPPLKANWNLTVAARWFSWDSTENRPGGYCGHQDTNGQWPSDRGPRFGYPSSLVAENAFCGYVTPEQGIEGWMNSPGHRDNMLNPESREIGLGYYRNSTGRGYIAKKLALDHPFGGVIIAHEAISTPTPLVSLYTQHFTAHATLLGFGPALQMRVSESPCFEGASWITFTPTFSWTLSPGEGWKTVWSQTRDAWGRTMTTNDVIYYGASVPLDQLDQYALRPSQVVTTVTLFNVPPPGAWTGVQFSNSWLADDRDANFKVWWGSGERVNDALARGGTAHRLFSRGTFAWVWDTQFITNTPMVAYFRLKTPNNTSGAPLIRIGVESNHTVVASRTLRSVDFAAPNQYQVFPLKFTFDNRSDPFLKFTLSMVGDGEVYFDVVLVFTEAQPLTTPLTWVVPRGYRGRGIWVRYVNGDQVSPIYAGMVHPPSIEVATAGMTFLAGHNGPPPPAQRRTVRAACTGGWQVQSSAPWLTAQQDGDALVAQVQPLGLSVGEHSAQLTLRPNQQVHLAPVVIPVRLIVAEQVHRRHLPYIAHNGAR